MAPVEVPSSKVVKIFIHWCQNWRTTEIFTQGDNTLLWLGVANWPDQPGDCSSVHSSNSFKQFPHYPSQPPGSSGHNTRRSAKNIYSEKNILSRNNLILNIDMQCLFCQSVRLILRNSKLVQGIQYLDPPLFPSLIKSNRQALTLHLPGRVPRYAKIASETF